MLKIADAGELECELRKILAYTQTDTPSRARLSSMLTTLRRRLTAGAFVDEAYLQEVADLFRRAVAKTRFIMGTPEFRSTGPVLYMRCRLQPYNESGVDSLDVWIRDGVKVRVTVAGQYVPMDVNVESQGFGQVMADDSFVYQGEPPARFVQRIARLALTMK